MTVSPIEGGSDKSNHIPGHEGSGEVPEQLSRELGGMTLREVMAKVEATADSFQRAQQMGHIAQIVLYLRSLDIPTPDTQVEEKPPIESVSAPESVDEVEEETTFNGRQAHFLQRVYGKVSEQLRPEDAEIIARDIIELHYGKMGKNKGSADTARRHQIVTLFLQDASDSEIAEEFRVSEGALSGNRDNMAKKLEEKYELAQRVHSLAKKLPIEKVNEVVQTPDIQPSSPRPSHQKTMQELRLELAQKISEFEYDDAAIASFKKLLSAQDTKASPEELAAGRTIMSHMIGAYRTEHEKDYARIDPRVRQMLQKISGYKLSQNAFPQSMHQILRFLPDDKKDIYEKVILTTVKTISSGLEQTPDEDVVVNDTPPPPVMTKGQEVTHLTDEQKEEEVSPKPVDLFNVGLHPGKSHEGIGPAVKAMFDNARTKGIMTDDNIELIKARLLDIDPQPDSQTRAALKKLADLASVYRGRLVEREAANMQSILALFSRQGVSISNIQQRVENDANWKDRQIRPHHVRPLLYGAMSEVFLQAEKSRNR